MSGQKPNLQEAERLCDYMYGRPTWPYRHMIELAGLGFELQRIGAFDLRQFVADPEAYLRQVLPAEIADWQLTQTDISEEARRAKEYLDRGLKYDNRPANKQDVTRLLDNGWLVRLEVNGQRLVGKPGFEGHSIVAVGYNKTGIYIHNPDGLNGNIADCYVAWSLLEKAWEEFGFRALAAYRKS